jgi:peptidoglycan hydrolase CwlO-like protein
MKNPKIKNLHGMYKQRPVAAFLVTVIALSAISVPLAGADRFSQKINELRAQNSQKKEAQYDLAVQAIDLKDKINKLQEQIYILQGQIRANQARSEDLQKQIVAAENELAKQKQLLGENIKAMYLEGDITTIEMLATSKDLSEFVDKQEYRNAVKEKIKLTLEKITALKQELRAQKEEVEKLIAEQKAIQMQLDAQRSEQNRLLALNQDQRSKLDQEIKANANRITELQRQQVLENARLFGGRMPAGIPGGGGYQWGDAICMHPGWADPPCGQYDWGYPGYGIYDKWGYGYRNCTSYVAWKVNQSGRRILSGLGHAKNWPYAAASRGVSVDYGQGARVGDAAVSTGGTYGHVMYVEAVEGDTVYVSDYNAGGDGYYRPARARSQSGLHFIHF